MLLIECWFLNNCRSETFIDVNNQHEAHSKFLCWTH